ncbi:hypothetical protein [Vibrio alfacsensis]|uniref:hypothetical protein n=1 Tax=Vibrio alfacsensis TaxID=1074311 RepID=UPI0040679D93
MYVSNDQEYQARMVLTEDRLKNETHQVWATVDVMVPEAGMSAYLAESGRKSILHLLWE